MLGNPNDLKNVLNGIGSARTKNWNPASNVSNSSKTSASHTPITDAVMSTGAQPSLSSLKMAPLSHITHITHITHSPVPTVDIAKKQLCGIQSARKITFDPDARSSANFEELTEIEIQVQKEEDERLSKWVSNLKESERE